MDEHFSEDSFESDREIHLDIARLNYEEKDYEATYKCLTSVLDSDPWNLEARELRALAAKHLHNPSYDWKVDAEFLIEAEPHCACPYFILIDNYLSHGHFRDALLLARAATLRVYHTDPELGKLKALCAKLQRTEINFLVKLPTEVLCTIFKLLPFKTRLNCITVSKRWRNTLIKIPDIWDTIDFGRTYNEDSIILALNTYSAWSAVRKLCIPAFNRSIGALMHHKFQCIRQLDITRSDQHLDDLVFVLCMREIGQSWQEVSFSWNVEARVFFAAAAHFCPNLEKVTVSYYGQRYIGSRNIEKDVLKELDPSLGFDRVVPVKTLVMDHSIFDSLAVRSIVPRCIALQDLVMKYAISFSPGEAFFQSMATLPTLHSISIQQHGDNRSYVDRYREDPTDLCILLRENPPETLDISQCRLTRETVKAIIEAMRRGTFKRYNSEFRMDIEEDRTRLRMLSRLDLSETQVYIRREMELAYQVALYAHEYDQGVLGFPWYSGVF
ncbi:hypothetical protein BX666DRAFT_2022651 [Dichotomocladium elegans]|nr:hypothetical protein BX666DRAFT_2022651 [Dichotomocladium elegans]